MHSALSFDVILSISVVFAVAQLFWVSGDALQPVYSRWPKISKVWLTAINAIMYVYAFGILSVIIYLFIDETFYGGQNGSIWDGRWYLYLAMGIAVFLMATIRFNLGAKLWNFLPDSQKNLMTACGNLVVDSIVGLLNVGRHIAVGVLWLVAIAILGLFIYAAIEGVAKLPVSVAIVLGALIIASALGSRRA